MISWAAQLDSNPVFVVIEKLADFFTRAVHVRMRMPAAFTGRTEVRSMDRPTHLASRKAPQAVFCARVIGLKKLNEFYNVYTAQEI